MSKTDWLDILACPSCRGDLALTVFRAHPMLFADEGVLLCSECASWYPVLNGVPRLLIPGPLRSDDHMFIERWKEEKPGPWVKRVQKAPKAVKSPKNAKALDAQAQVQSVFQFKWKTQSEWGIKGGAATFMENWLFSKYGWKNAADYKNFMAGRRLSLDAGCGLGREAIRMAESNPNAAVIGLELSGCVDEARAHADQRKLSNLLIVQGDVHNPPFKRNRFDLVLSEGVLHHTHDTFAAVKKLSELLTNKGEIAFYVYRKKAPLREFADDFVREKLQGVPLDEALRMMESLTQLGKALSDLKVELDIPADVPLLGFNAGRVDLQRWIYNSMFKCFWSDVMSFHENVLVNFDWYLPKYAWRHTEQEVKGWIQKIGMSPVWEFVEEAGITMRAVKSAGR